MCNYFIKIFSNPRRLFCRTIHLFHIMQFFLTQLFGYNILSSKKSIFDKLTMVVKELQLPLILEDVKREIQNHVLGTFLSVKGDERSHIIDGTYSKCIIIPFTSQALDWFVVMDASFHCFFQ